MKYFAYGSNMLPERIMQRCPDATLVGRAYLSGWKFVIAISGYANIVPCPGEVVWGVVYDLSTEDKVKLDVCEGTSEGFYHHKALGVVVNGKMIGAMAYIESIGGEGYPRMGYMDIVTEGARFFGLPPTYQKELKLWADKMPKRRPFRIRYIY
jgi:hypothetical protein